MYSAEEAVNAIRELITISYSINEIPKGPYWYQEEFEKYNGPEITSSRILSTTKCVKDSLKADAIDNALENGQDLLNVLLFKLFQLGYNSAAEAIDGENKVTMDLLKRSLALTDKSLV